MGLEPYSSWSSVDCSGQQLPELWASGPVSRWGSLGEGTSSSSSPPGSNRSRPCWSSSLPALRSCQRASLEWSLPSQARLTGAWRTRRRHCNHSEASATHEQTHLRTWLFIHSFSFIYTFIGSPPCSFFFLRLSSTQHAGF